MITPTPSSDKVDPGAPETMPIPHLVKPGSIPKTRMPLA